MSDENTDPALTKWQIKKLQQEVLLLRRPFFKDPNKWAPWLVAVLVALGSLAGSLGAVFQSNNEREILTIQVSALQKEKEETEAEIESIKGILEETEYQVQSLTSFVIFVRNEVIGDIQNGKTADIEDVWRRIFERNELSLVYRDYLQDGPRGYKNYLSLYRSRHGFFFECKEIHIDDGYLNSNDQAPANLLNPRYQYSTGMKYVSYKEAYFRSEERLSDEQHRQLFVRRISISTQK